MQSLEVASKSKDHLITIDLSKFIPSSELIKSIDLADWLFQGLLLKEKDFRAAVKAHDWEQYSEAFVHVFCSTDAIIAPWAYMLVATQLKTYCKRMVYGTEDTLIKTAVKESINALDLQAFENQTVLVKGCGDKRITHEFYMQLAEKLHGVVRRLHYGEACSFVPVYKKSVSKT